MFHSPKKEWKSTTLMLEQKQSYFLNHKNISDNVTVSDFFYYIFKTVCFASNMKNWLFLGDFEARMKNRKAIKDAGEKAEYV